MEHLLHPRGDGGPFPCLGDSGYIPAWASPEVLGQTGLSPVPLLRGDWQVSIKRRGGTAVAFLGEPVPVNPSAGSMSHTTLLVLGFGFFGGGVPSYLSVPAGSVPGSCLGAQFTNETGNWAKSPNKVAGGGTFSLCQGPSLRPGTVLALAPCLCPLGHGAAGQHPQAMKDVRGEEEEGQGGRCDHSLGKGVSCWEAGGESLKFGLRGASWILLPWHRGSTGVHEPGKEMAALHGCQPHLGRGCPFFYI